MCNLYALTTAQDALRRVFAPLPLTDRLGNLAPLPEVYPDYRAPVIRTGAEGREMVMGRWGMPTPPQFLRGKKTDRSVTNIRNTRSPHWRRWLAPECRCLVPFSRFAEADIGSAPRRNLWFELPDERPAFFAGIWTRWTSVRKLKDGETTDDLFGFLTTASNAEVGVVHPKPMPVILTTPEEWEAWLSAPWAEAAELQCPLPDGSLRIA